MSNGFWRVAYDLRHEADYLIVPDFSDIPPLHLPGDATESMAVAYAEASAFVAAAHLEKQIAKKYEDRKKPTVLTFKMPKGRMVQLLDPNTGEFCHPIYYHAEYVNGDIAKGELVYRGYTICRNSTGYIVPDQAVTRSDFISQAVKKIDRLFDK